MTEIVAYLNQVSASSVLNYKYCLSFSGGIRSLKWQFSILQRLAEFYFAVGKCPTSWVHSELPVATQSTVMLEPKKKSGTLL